MQSRPTMVPPPLAIVVMGVSGCGKSTLGTRLAAALACPFLEGDEFHSPENVAKMSAGQPLDDADRWPWLGQLGTALGEVVGERNTAVCACSALKRSYRERLADAAGVPVFFVLLDVDREELERRMAKRRGHYMPATLLDSQLAALERPAADECAMTLDSSEPIEELCARALARIKERRAALIAG